MTDNVTGMVGFEEEVAYWINMAVRESVANAVEHGNKYDPERKVRIEVAGSESAVRVRISDHGGGKKIVNTNDPDLDAKLAGDQSPRGWGLFLIKNMVDEMNVIQDESQHTVELLMMYEAEG